MNDVIEYTLKALKNVSVVEKELLRNEQVECSVIHHFGPGIYIREVNIPAGTLAIGHHQKHDHMNIMLKGRVTILNDSGTTSELKAPMMFVGKPGRKIGYIHEDMVWLNIYSATETDVEILEERFLIKSDEWMENKVTRDNILRLQQNVDREDYIKVLSERGISQEYARAQSENTLDQIDIPYCNFKVIKKESTIDGYGLFATANIVTGEIIAPARISGKRTFAGRYTNHSIKPNAEMVLHENGNIDMRAMRNINGCRGGQDGEEITINYRQALALVEGVSLCQQ